jgi:hypothetical protein
MHLPKTHPYKRSAVQVAQDTISMPTLPPQQQAAVPPPAPSPPLAAAPAPPCLTVEQQGTADPVEACGTTGPKHTNKLVSANSALP